jgi:hypothetical protein
MCYQLPVVAYEIISGYTWCKKSKRSFTFRYITLHGYFSIMELPAATGAITAEPASLETNVKIVRIQGSV